jgi:CDGSH-type Zn-finger protein
MTEENLERPSITALANGPYLVEGRLPLYRRRAVNSEHGEPLTWETTAALGSRDRYVLCRCGQSSSKPLCDGTHAKVGFIAADSSSGLYADRAKTLGGTGITVRDDRSVCVHAGFCGSRVTNVWKEVAKTAESTVRAQIIAMVERCPSGALTYSMDSSGDVEPLMPAAAAVVDDGPLWVTGRVNITTADGQSIEARNRVTLCRCGGSKNKPLCDGTHKEIAFRDS